MRLGVWGAAVLRPYMSEAAIVLIASGKVVLRLGKNAGTVPFLHHRKPALHAQEERLRGYGWAFGAQRAAPLHDLGE